MSIYIKWEERKKTDQEETMKMYQNLNEKELVPGIEELVKQGTTLKSYPEDPLPLNVLPDEG